MKIIKVLLVAVAMMTTLSARAMTDDESVAFMSAVTGGNVAVVKKFIESGTANVNDTFFAWSPLLSAASKNQLGVVKVLVEHGANLNYQHPVTKMTPLAHAAYEGNNDIVKYLLEKGADPNIKMRGGVSLVRAARDEGHVETVKLLEQFGAKDDGCKDEKCL
ncbi:MAG TPA: ankyrin repeat domain-containing protein [Methylophilaceae bacterium]|nr:ankyrin repeat domain-containing protein [Methylophilaceae bacterium]